MDTNDKTPALGKAKKRQSIVRRYSFGEEIGNAVSHGLMALAVLFGLAPTAIHAYLEHGALGAVCVSIFMCSLFLMFLSSAIYHSMTADTKQHQIMQILDHIFIYFAIAGSYTPLAILVIGGWQGIVVTVVQWVMVLFGILHKSIANRKVPKAALTIYLIMGWSVVFVLPMFLSNASLGLQLLILAGGIFYSAGTYFYAKKNKPFFHMIWHIFVNLGAVCHFLGILLFL
jgi:hemolysin III